MCRASLGIQPLPHMDQIKMRQPFKPQFLNICKLSCLCKGRLLHYATQNKVSNQIQCHQIALTFSTLWAYSADDTLAIFSLFFHENGMSKFIFGEK